MLDSSHIWSQVSTGSRHLPIADVSQVSSLIETATQLGSLRAKPSDCFSIVGIADTCVPMMAKDEYLCRCQHDFISNGLWGL